jgi:hypothetical protein
MQSRFNQAKKTVLARALMIAFGSAVLTAGWHAPAIAQSNATATIFGHVPATPGSVIVLENLATGARRTITPAANGQYQATSMPPGQYKVQLLRGAQVEGTQQVEALTGQGVEVSFAAADAVQTVSVKARRVSIDVSNTNNGAIFTAKQLKELPIAQSVGGIIQLAPGTTRADSAIGGESFGGAGASENGYYINGFPVTNVYKQLGGSTLPFFAIGQAQILSGGYSAEFGRSTGGVVNITTKSGSNRWEAGATLQFEPERTRAKTVNLNYANTGANPASDNKLERYREGNTQTDKFVSAFVSGPLIKDKLFAFANVEQTFNSSAYSSLGSETPSASVMGYSERERRQPRWLLKLDYNISDNHRLEFTQIHDEQKDDFTVSGFDYNSLRRNFLTNNTSSSGTKTDDSILKYTGYLTPDLTATVLYGQSRSAFPNSQSGILPGVYQVTAQPSNRVPGLVYVTPQISGTEQVANAEDSQKTLRLDVEYKLGRHALRSGLDINRIASVNGKTLIGGGLWTYYKSSPTRRVPTPDGKTPLEGGGFGTQGYYVSEYHESDAATPSTDQSAQYIQDRYQVTDNVLLDLGLRNEQFTNKNSAGVAYAAQRHQLAPRLGVAWDVNRDGSMKMFANAGRYHLQIPTSVAQRIAGNPAHTNHYFTYTGVDPVSGAPTGVTSISGVYSSSNEYGQPKDPRQSSVANLKANFQDEITLGFERAWSPALTFGVKGTYRTLKSAIEDYCDSRPILAWAARNKVATNRFDLGCVLVNPGTDNTFVVDLKRDGHFIQVPLTAQEIGLAPLKRTYTALDLFIEHPLKDGWYGRINYTFSKSRGNLEGQVSSDNGQADIAATVAYDYPELGTGADGLLPNNHTHVIKALGYYKVSEQFSVGANLNITSGAPLNCFGNLPEELNRDGSNPAADYGSATFYCDGKLNPRGTRGTLPTDIRLALAFIYKPQQLKGLTLKTDVFNLLNRQTPLSVKQEYNSGGQINPHYLRVNSTTPARSLRFSAEYLHQF